MSRAAMAGDVTSSLTHSSTGGLNYINADYTLTLSRLPDGEYIGLAALTHYSHAGVATGTAAIFDRLGPIGSGVATPGVGTLLKSPAVAKTLQDVYHRLNSKAQKYEALTPEARQKWEEYYGADQKELSHQLQGLRIID